MLVGACYTLFRMRKSLGLGMARAVADLKKSARHAAATDRTDRDLGAKPVFLGLAVVVRLHDRCSTTISPASCSGADLLRRSS